MRPSLLSMLKVDHIYRLRHLSALYRKRLRLLFIADVSAQVSPFIIKCFSVAGFDCVCLSTSVRGAISNTKCVSASASYQSSLSLWARQPSLVVCISTSSPTIAEVRSLGLPSIYLRPRTPSEACYAVVWLIIFLKRIRA